MIREALAGKRIGVTGATGFLGTALVERLLRSVPECYVVVLVRPGRRTNAETRVHREILRNDAFDGLRATLGGRAVSLPATRNLRVLVTPQRTTRLRG